MAFHLGCLKALHEAGLLDQVSVISSVSGGSVIAALYCSYPGTFEEFESHVKYLLSTGFVRPSIILCFTTLEGVKALGTFIPLTFDRTFAMVIRLLAKMLRIPGVTNLPWIREAQIRRRASRTTILRRTFRNIFNGKKLTDLRSDRPRLVIVACELRAKAAFYFTKEKVHCWRYGSADPGDIEIADAVTASAAYPLALPALDERMVFEKNGTRTIHRVTLTDGGVYDNLGLGPLWPGRDSTISLNVGSFKRIIACRAGYSLEVADSPSFTISRMAAAFECVFARAQNLSNNRLYDLKRSGDIDDFILPYLGQRDELLTHAPTDIVTRESTAGYPTNFSAMKSNWVIALSLRGEQLVHALLKQHWSASNVSPN